jgi:PAT family beta-lactamase induction signal transducer AmpG
MIATTEKSSTKSSAHEFWIFLFGCCSGTLLMLTGNTLNFWLAKLGIDLKTIGLSSLIALPYVLKYLLAPFIEKYSFFGSNRRKSWLSILAILILLFGILIGRSNPLNTFFITAIMGFLLSLSAVSTDIILDSYRVDFASLNQSYGKTSGNFVVGYKIGMLISSSGAILLSTIVEWSTVYFIFSSFAAFLILIFIKFLPNKINHKNEMINETKSLINIFLLPFNHFKSKAEILIVLAFVITYKIADQYILSMINPFLLHLNYNEYEISIVVKTCGALGSIAGGIIGGFLISRFGIKNCLLYFAIVHSCSNFLFILQELVGHNLMILYLLTMIGTTSSGMAMCVYISYIMSISSGKYSGTKYAFYSSLIGCSRVLLPSSSGFIVEFFGWNIFFLAMIVISVPGMILTRYLPYQKNLPK